MNNDRKQDRKKIKNERGRSKEGRTVTCSVVLVRRRFTGGSFHNSIVLQVAIDRHSPLWACILFLTNSCSAEIGLFCQSHFCINRSQCIFPAKGNIPPQEAGWRWFIRWNGGGVLYDQLRLTPPFQHPKYVM